MAVRGALIIAVESFLEAGPPVPYAAGDAADVFRLLPTAGYSRDRCLLLSGPFTTRAIIDSHLRRLPRLMGKADSLLVLVVSRGFSRGGRGYIACSDTLAADPVGTALPVAELIAALHKSRCPEIAVLLDLDPLSLADNATSPGLDAAELKRLFDESPSCVGLLASEPGTRSFESAELRRGIWRHHLIEAFSGKARESLSQNGTVTAASLHDYLTGAVPRSLARTYESPREQAPMLLGEHNAAMGVAEMGRFAATGSGLIPEQMKRIVFRSETAVRVKDLSGYRKSHALPDRANEWARKYVNRVAAADIKVDIDRTYDAIRETFGYKRKDLEASAGRDGIGFIRTPEFEYTVSVAVNPDDPAEAIWRREVGRLSDPGLIRTEAFAAVFGQAFDRLVFEPAVPLDVGLLVDQIEDRSLEGLSVAVASEADSAELKLAGFPGRILLSSEGVIIEGRAGGSTEDLLDRFLAFLLRFNKAGETFA